MRRAVLAFLSGVLALQGLPSLPSRAALLAATILIPVVALGAARLPWPRARLACLLCAALLAGGTYAAWRAEWRLADTLPMQAEARDLPVTGVVEALPQRLPDGAWRFVLAVESADAPVPRRVQLGWYGFGADGGRPPELRPGERWQLVVRLRRPHGLHNPGVFDYSAWLLERGIRATGYVRRHDDNRRLDASVPGFLHAVHRVRDTVRRDFARRLGDAPQAGILTALAVGDQRAIPEAQWDIFRRTATGHLVAISGLHVSLVALAVGGLAGALWRRVPALVIRVPARTAAAVAGLLAAVAYALLAGLALPTQRALAMLAVAVLAVAMRRQAEPTRVLALALFVVLAFDPWAVLSAGFWLSFGAVAVIVFVVAGRLAPEDGMRAAVRVQMAITVLLAPVLWALFGTFSVAGPIANALAIPLVSFVIAPLTLLAAVLPVPGPLEAAHAATAAMMWVLDALAAHPIALWHGSRLPPVLIGCALVGGAWLLMPRGTPARFAGLLAMVPMFLWSPPRPADGAFTVTVLDVGQGLAVHVQTARHDLLYDAGPGYGSGGDAADRVVLPYLRGQGVRRLDALVLSHGDGDHAGGAATVLAELPVTKVWRGADVRLPDGVEASDCVAGQGWSVDRVRLRFIHPAPATKPARRNEGSCVLRVESEYGAVLLPGDIGAATERRLAGDGREALAADVVVAPHHGSGGSSSPALVAASGAAHVIHSAGMLNPHRHPHPDVWSRWATAGARNWRTDAQGAVTVGVSASGVAVHAHRERAPRYWHGR